MHHLIQRIKDRRRAKEMLRQYDLEEIAVNMDPGIAQQIACPYGFGGTTLDYVARYIEAHRSLKGTEFRIKIEEEYDH